MTLFELNLMESKEITISQLKNQLTKDKKTAIML